ncbi:MAG: class I SAM-dependent methyltransferase [Cyclobacteriaceae bacterium]|jgi:SAM-dependent methyltransferase|nr:class I SAM-dependent methyltransferase [Cyclobacteriaceae bacterium]
MSKQLWDERYAAHEIVYGYEPNVFFKEQLDRLTPGKLLLPAEGEGRNALYAASRGWEVTAYDFSEVAREKTLKRAREKQLAIDYFVDDLTAANFQESTFDSVGLIFAHLPAHQRRDFHRKCLRALKPGGTLILEGFSKEQLAFQSGGPKDEAMLFDEDMLRKDFQDLYSIRLQKLQITLQEGPFHQGPAAVIRLTGVKA